MAALSGVMVFLLFVADATESEWGSSAGPGAEDFFNTLNVVFTTVFTIELVVNMYGHWFRDFFFDAWVARTHGLHARAAHGLRARAHTRPHTRAQPTHAGGAYTRASTACLDASAASALWAVRAAGRPMGGGGVISSRTYLGRPQSCTSLSHPALPGTLRRHPVRARVSGHGAGGTAVQAARPARCAEACAVLGQRTHPGARLVRCWPGRCCRCWVRLGWVSTPWGEGGGLGDDGEALRDTALRHHMCRLLRHCDTICVAS